jgi:putative copper export protein
MMEILLPPVQRGILFAGLMGLGGIAAWRLWIAPWAEPGARETGASEGDAAGAGPRDVDELRQWSSRVGAVLAFGLLPVWGLRLQVQVLGFRDPFVPWWEDASFLIAETVWGWSWMVQGAILLLLGLLFWRDARGGERSADLTGKPPAWLLVGVAGLALTNALASHAMSVPFNRWVAVALDALHLLAAGSWIGSLILILVLARGPREALLAPQLRAFSPVAMVSVAILGFSGLQLSAQHLMAWENVFGSPYGRMLVVKVAIVGVVLAMGAWNWRRGLPLLDTQHGRRLVRTRAGMEIAAAALVLAATAILTGMSMPEGTH